MKAGNNNLDTSVRQEKERNIWDRLASGYDANTGKTYKDAYRESIDRTKKLLDATDRVLEIGCGTGINSLGIASQCSSVTGVDISPVMIEQARTKAASENVQNLTFEVFDGYTLPFDSAAFDKVLLFNILYIVKEPQTLLAEAHRLLKPGGLLVTATDCLKEPVDLYSRIVMGYEWAMHKLGIIPFISFYRKKDVESLISQKGFTLMETANLHPSPVNYYVMAKKE